MEFTLTYVGPLKPSGKPADKQAVRGQIEAQLRELWTHEPLVRHREQLTEWPAQDGQVCALQERPSGFYLPVVSREFGLRAELDIVMLRPETAGGIIISGGDIDNRLKTLFDGLRPPLTVQEATSPTLPDLSDPFHVLLSDDELITGVSVKTDRLLAANSSDDVWITIHVRTKCSAGCTRMWASSAAAESPTT